MKYPLLNRFNGIVGLRTAGGRDNLLNTSISLDKPLKSDEEGLVFGDTLESVEANYKMESVIEKEYLKKLHDDLGKCLDMLEPLQKEVIQGKYYSDKTVKEIADTAGLTYSKTRDIEVKALSTMRRKRAYKELLEPYRMDIINSYGYRSSFSAWKNTLTSSTERAVLMLSKLDKLI